MGVCDLGLALKFCFNGMMPGELAKHSWQCELSGFAGTFFWWTTNAWYFLIALGVYAALAPTRSLDVDSHRRAIWQHVFVWIPAFFAAGLPEVLDAYEPVDENTTCWYRNDMPLLRLINLVPVALYMVFAIYLLVYTIFILRAIDLPTPNSRVIMLRMLWFVGVFVAAFFPSILTLAWSMVSSDTLPYALNFLTAFQTIGSGFYNLLVWASSPAFARAFFSRCPCGPHARAAKLRERSSLQSKARSAYAHSSDGGDGLSGVVGAAAQTKLQPIGGDDLDGEESYGMAFGADAAQKDKIGSYGSSLGPAESIGIAVNSGDFYAALDGDDKRHGED